ncbi:MAG: hypothetical protein ACUVWP_01910 [bacterium]
MKTHQKDQRLRRHTDMKFTGSFRFLRRNLYIIYLCFIIVIIIFSISNSLGQLTSTDLFKMTVKEGDTVDLLGLIKDESYMLYGGLIKVSNCSVNSDILKISNKGYEGYLEIGKNNEKWCDYEVSGKFLLAEVPYELLDKKLLCFDIVVHYNHNEESSNRAGREIIRIFPEKEILLIDYSGSDDKPRKIVRKKTTLRTGIWYKFSVIVKGSSVTFFVDGKKIVSSKKLSSVSGGFRLYPLSLNKDVYEVSLKELRLKINRWGD